VAIEIPSLSADRLPHPEWPAATSPGRLLVPAGRLLAALERAGVATATLDGLRATAAAGGDAQLAVSPDHGIVQLLLDGRRVPLTGAAREAVLSLLGDAAAAGTPAPLLPAASGAVDPFLAARVAAVDAQVQEARAHAGSASGAQVELAEPEATIVAAAPLMRGADAAQASQSLARAVDGSGLFLEAHVAQWLRGERSLAQVLDEVRALPRVDGGATAAAAAVASEDRARRQLDAQQNQLVRLHALAWPGQTMELQISEDPERRPEGEATAAGLFQASLSLHLPRLGTVQARIRLLHDTVGLQIAGEQAALLAPALQSLVSAFQSRGLHLAAVDLGPAVAATRKLPGSP